MDGKAEAREGIALKIRVNIIVVEIRDKRAGGIEGRINNFRKLSRGDLEYKSMDGRCTLAAAQHTGDIVLEI